MDVSEDDFDFMFDTNVKGAFFVAQEVGKRMLARAQGRSAGQLHRRAHHQCRVAWQASGAAQIGVYCMSKAAVIQMTRAMAVEWGRFGINVNAICPGYIDTEINHPTGRPSRAKNWCRCCRASVLASRKTWMRCW